MANEPKVLNVNNYQTTTEKVSGGQGTSSATVSSAPKELQKSEQSQVGVDLTNVKGTATGNTEERSLKVSKDATVGSYVADTNRAGNPGRTKRNIVNTVTVEEVKALIKKYGGGDSYSKEQIDEMLATIREGQYVKVDTTEYPTLEDFLASEGEQGTVYLYPVGNEENNYYQYIWEVSEWVSLGTTELDLSNYATKDEAFNVINAADIVNSTLTQAQYDLVTNGKPTIIMGSFLTFTNPILFPPYRESGGYRFGLFIGTASTKNEINEFYINPSKTVAVNPAVRTLNIISSSIDTKTLNGKTIPAYPTTNTFPQVLAIGANGGALSWSDASIQKLTSTEWSGLTAEEKYNLIKSNIVYVLGRITVANVNYKNPIFFPASFNGYFADIEDTTNTGFIFYNLETDYTAISIGTWRVETNVSYRLQINDRFSGINLPVISKIKNIAINEFYKKPQASVTIIDGGTITDTDLKTLIQNEQPIKLNGYTGYFSCDDGTNYQYHSIIFDSVNNVNHLNVVTINKTTWVVTFHTSNFALN